MTCSCQTVKKIPQCRLSCFSKAVFGLFLSLILVIFSIPIGLFYGWRDPHVNEWRNENYFSKVLEHIENCTNPKNDNIQIIGSKLWNNVISSCENTSVIQGNYHKISVSGNNTVMEVHIEFASAQQPPVDIHLLTEPLTAYRYENTVCSGKPNFTYLLCQLLKGEDTNNEFGFMNLTTPASPKTLTAESIPLACLSNETSLNVLVQFLMENSEEFSTHKQVTFLNRSDEFASNGTVTAEGPSRCTSQYVDMCKVCIPKCSSFHINLATDTDRTTEEDVTIAAGIFALFGALVVIIFAVIRRDEMLTFPSVLVLYETILEIALVLSVVIPLAGNEDLFCSYDDAIRTMYSEPTPYCTFSGIVFQFTAVSICVMWLIHVIYIAILIKFPFFGEKMKRKLNLIHIMSIIITIALGCVGPVVTMGSVGYFTARFPVFVCLPRNIDALFYSISCPVAFLVAAGTAIWISLYRELRKTFHSKHEKERRSLYTTPVNTVSTAERKVLFLATSMLIVSVAVLSRFSQNFANQYAFTHMIAEYPYCQLHSDGSTTRCVTNQFQGGTYPLRPIMDGTLYFVFALLPFLNWTFPLKPSDFKKLKECMCTLLHTFKLLRMKNPLVKGNKQCNFV